MAGSILIAAALALVGIKGVRWKLHALKGRKASKMMLENKESQQGQRDGSKAFGWKLTWAAAIASLGDTLWDSGIALADCATCYQRQVLLRIASACKQNLCGGDTRRSPAVRRPQFAKVQAALANCETVSWSIQEACKEAVYSAKLQGD